MYTIILDIYIYYLYISLKLLNKLKEVDLHT